MPKLTIQLELTDDEHERISTWSIERVINDSIDGLGAYVDTNEGPEFKDDTREARRALDDWTSDNELAKRIVCKLWYAASRLRSIKNA